jgi:hypothetical protein
MYKFAGSKSTKLVVQKIGVIVTLYHSCGTFFHRERLQQQNGDGVKTICIWLHLVQGRVY